MNVLYYLLNLPPRKEESHAYIFFIQRQHLP